MPTPRETYSLSLRDVLILLAAFIITRAAITAFGTFAVLRLDMNVGEEYTHLLEADGSIGGAALDMWYRWDAGFYATIATYGYDWYNERIPADDMAFMPVYPALVRTVSALIGTGSTGCAFSPYLSTCATISGVIVSNIVLFAALVLLFDIAARRFNRPTAWRAVWLLLISPISIYLSGVYTEATFLLLSLLTFWLLDRKRFALAVIAACAAAITRSVGIALVPALLIYAWRDTSASRWIRLILALLPAAVFGAYIVGIGAYVGDPLAYFSTYELTWGREAGNVITAFTSYFSGEEVALMGWRLSWLDLGMTLTWLALAAFTFRMDRAWGAFGVVALVIPIASGTLVGMPRFGAVIFAFYVLLAHWADRGWKLLIIYGASAALALLMLTRFVTWRWIA